MVLSKIKARINGTRLQPSEVRPYLTSESFQPVFFLSTGRCGTAWFTELLEQNKKLDVHHATLPELYEQGLFAYRILQQTQPDEKLLEALFEIVFAARQELMATAVMRGKRFVETNNRITFFAPVLAAMFPHAKFVHLYREPAGFVKSGMNRGWYQSHRSDYARLSPLDGDEKNQWTGQSRVAQIAWLWRETNMFIDRSLQDLPEDRFQRFNFTGIDKIAVQKLLQWLEIDISPGKIKAHLHKKVNAQKKGRFPGYEDWSDAHKRDFLENCGEYAAQLGFRYKP
ncbi:MAG: hypothetical protein EA392_07940 [Cryomorphaceae bacterium]|nr:MAG: hypothetical protein EA392_07940 [Cryomorphaceae bacterium]